MVRLARSLGFAVTLADELAEVAEVSIDEEGWGVNVAVLPRRPGARSVGWADFGEEIVLQVGEFGGRWELGGDDEDLLLLEAVVRSVVAGRVTEILAPGRSRVIVVLADGERQVETGYQAPVGCIPLPLWPRWSRTVRYSPYGESSP
jgi:hypothetical protein